MSDIVAKGLKDRNGKKVAFDYESLENKPRINGQELTGDFQLLTEADNELDANSTNPVQNKIITQAIWSLNAAQNLLDIVGTYQDLIDKYPIDEEFVDTEDKIKVLRDENYDNQATYYRWNGTNWEFIGLEPVPKIEKDEVVTEGSTNLITSGAVADYVKKEIDNAIVSALTGEY